MASVDQRHRMMMSRPIESFIATLRCSAARAICVAHGSQPCSGIGGRPRWFITILSSGNRCATSSTDSNCAALTGMASNDEPGGGEQLERFDHAVLQQPARIGLVADEMAHADELAAAPRSRSSACDVASGSASGSQPTTPRTKSTSCADVETLLGLAADLMQHLDQHACP